MRSAVKSSWRRDVCPLDSNSRSGGGSIVRAGLKKSSSSTSPVNRGNWKKQPSSSAQHDREIPSADSTVRLLWNNIYVETFIYTSLEVECVVYWKHADHKQIPWCSEWQHLIRDASSSLFFEQCHGIYGSNIQMLDEWYPASLFLNNLHITIPHQLLDFSYVLYV